jgi:hypothetical protein
MAVTTDDAVAVPALPGPFGAASAAVSALQDLDLDRLSLEELSEAVVAFQQLRARVESAEARLVARWDATKAWQLDGAKTPAAWIAWRTRLPVEEARRRVRHARALRALPALAAAWSAGEIDRTHLTTILGARNERTAERFATDHTVLLEAARILGFVDFKRTRDRWVNIVDPDGAEQTADHQRAAREVHLSKSLDGMWFGRTTLDPISGEIVGTTLAEIDNELFRADWAAAKERLGRDPLIVELDRSPAQRRADALVEMATRARTAPADGRRPAPLFTVVVGYETFAGPVLELFNRTVITPGTAARWLTDAYVERVVFDSPSRVIDVGAQRRFFRGALRRAIEVRDRTCFHPTCDDVPQRTEIDHIHEASCGGPTTQDNGWASCGHHNRDRYRLRWANGQIGRPYPTLDDLHPGPDPPDD